MRGLSIAFFSLMLATLTSPCAYADSIFDFTFSGGAISASGQFTASSTGVGTYLITGVSGTMNGATITGVLPPKSFAGNDNVLQDPGPVLDHLESATALRMATQSISIPSRALIVRPFTIPMPRPS
jgi:hypothetical protein